MHVGFSAFSWSVVYYISGSDEFMPKFTVVVRPDEVSAMLAKRLQTDLLKHGYEMDETSPETVFVIGGDGTFLFAVHQYLKQLDKLCFFGIHTGTLGFYTDYEDSEYDTFLEAFLNHQLEEIRYPLLVGKSDFGKIYAMNEIRIENPARTQEVNVYINHKKFETFRGTGLCIATQLGSTAYNRSLGGAVIEEGLPVIELTEIAGIHHSKYRCLGSPLILSDQTVIRMSAESFSGALLGADAEVFELKDCKEVEVQVCKEKFVRMLRGRKTSYFKKLKILF